MALAGTGVFAEILDGEVYKYYADGEWRVSGSGKTVAIVNPTTRKTQYKVQGAGSRLCLLPCFSMPSGLPPAPRTSGSRGAGASAVPWFGETRLMATQTC
jgi:hypothetical protein